MSVLILTKPTTLEYETIKLLTSFIDKGISAKVCQFSNFDIVVNKGAFYNGEPIDMPKLVLVRLGAGISRKHLAIVRYFELHGVICINTSQSINTAQDKLHTSEILSSHGIAVPTTVVARSKSPSNLITNLIGFPCILKIIVGSFGEGIHLCHSETEYIRLMEFISGLDSNKTIMAQEYLGDRPGEDLRVFVVGNKVIGAMKRSASVGDFRANITLGGTGENFPVTPEIEKIALSAAKALNLDIAGIDLLFDKRGFRVCEANSNPGFLGFEKYCGVDVAKEITSFVESKLL